MCMNLITIIETEKTNTCMCACIDTHTHTHIQGKDRDINGQAHRKNYSDFGSGDEEIVLNEPNLSEKTPLNLCKI